MAEIEPSSRVFVASIRSRAFDLEAVMHDVEALGLGRADYTRDRIDELRRLADDFEHNELALPQPHSTSTGEANE